MIGFQPVVAKFFIFLAFLVLVSVSSTSMCFLISSLAPSIAVGNFAAVSFFHLILYIIIYYFYILFFETIKYIIAVLLLAVRRLLDQFEQHAPIREVDHGPLVHEVLVYWSHD